ncbi:S9 family peptidase [Ferrimonas marina]|uniref:Dipeptidyl aminopeptidase/acylaminoacyl peptidase n=1 Tax=Ferrimonas marina TaxID=299255 RepID=A0A1M5ZPW0_9GAMM|nr:prolyl oligopeptidase family serine peptidase [Ferrimonas marina]SHI26231.1 Dipeptidyl aminopeptidase/acylaminoacyl peptidase [Ferrimonas marina]
MKPWIVACGVALALQGCASSTEPTPTASVAEPVSLSAPVTPDSPLTLKQIMADPDWMGRSPTAFYWGSDSRTVYYQQKQQGGPLVERFAQTLDGAPQKLGLAQWSQVVGDNGQWSADRRHYAWLYEGQLFVQTGSAIVQLTQDVAPLSGFRFLNDGGLALWRDGVLERIDLDGRNRRVLAQVTMEAAPKPTEPESYLAREQRKLSQYVDMNYRHDAARFEQKQARHDQDAALAPTPFYLGASERLVSLTPSPSGRYLLVALTDKDGSWRSEHDIMPDYLDRRGYVNAVKVRARVAEADPKGQRLVVLDRELGKTIPVTWEGLEGYDEDVLAAVKRENAEAQGESYQSEPAVRAIRLMQDWGWRQSAVVWHQQEDRLALMLEAIDNKDRWLATVDLAKGKLQTQDRLHDEAWVNYTHNEFGWLDAQTLYFLSEASGYSQLYLKPLAGKVRALTQGKQVVSNLTLSADKRHFYYQANPYHPGQYEVFRVAVADGQVEALTDLKGMLNYRLSPDESQLLLAYSSRIRPTELYLQPLGGEPRQLTQTTSQAFLDYDWQAPQVIAVPSSHQADPVYARLYLPQDYDPAKRYPAVIFNHGAGYLQNAHYGFSGYFREFMFHNLLAQQGYVVMDMDYRGSKGYGRDWRTAIYRNMGHPEVEDLRDGVEWMVANASVDRQRIGTYGGSYGGFLTFMALFTQPDLFQSGAALRPVTDWAHYNHPYTSNILNTPEVDHIAYERSSPIYHAEGLEKPLLIMSGVLDDNVFFQDSVRLVQRLIELEKPMFETAIYPVEPHGFRQPYSWLDEYRRIHRLFEQTLK